MNERHEEELSPVSRFTVNKSAQEDLCHVPVTLGGNKKAQEC